jgi:hypothetical protein
VFKNLRSWKISSVQRDRWCPHSNRDEYSFLPFDFTHARPLMKVKRFRWYFLVPGKKPPLFSAIAQRSTELLNQATALCKHGFVVEALSVQSRLAYQAF